MLKHTHTHTHTHTQWGTTEVNKALRFGSGHLRVLVNYREVP